MDRWNKIVIDLEDPIEEDGGWLLLERQTVNDRTLLCWYNGETQNISISLFNQTEQPNELSQKAKESQWGFMTYFVDNLKTEEEATELANLYLSDMENDNIWWEKPINH